ncbi:APC family permease [Candidatus Magnetomonas plexicatena]|uniref:APC family permease n=1 Tax=Candidatus Magnetomonas plexicatena TaxID=2552947 RepID=UPI00110420A4|nr:APC family permease [Nitrospirales bacterium LBB_01]
MSIKTFLIGRPIESVKEKHERVSKFTGLAVFSSDAMSSVAYATEEILIVLVLGGAGLLHYSMPIAIGITTLIAIVAASYFQTIHEYPSGGGAYIVAKDNLGINAGLAAGSALLIDYVLTVSVSISSGVAAITSAAPFLYKYRVMLCIISLLVITVVNLRGVKESGKIFSLPTYFFIAGIVILICVGLMRITSLQHATHPVQAHVYSDIMMIFLIMKAFSSGCTALTGIEAISNGVRAFKAPESKNAGITLIWMAIILGFSFTGITFLTHRFGILPSDNETILSQLAKTIFSQGFFYYFIQGTTFLILILAANTSFADFPRLSSIMAQDGYLPRQLANRGDKLVFSNGVIILSIFSAILMASFDGDTHSLIPLYAVGVFLSFTLSQAGMVVHWLKFKGKGWVKHIIINALGTITTATVSLVISTTKFIHGAWMVIIAIPIIMYATKKINLHYQSVSKQLSIKNAEPTEEYIHHSVVVPISGIQSAVLNAIKYAKAISGDVTAVYVCLDPVVTANVKKSWESYGMGIPLVILESPYRSIIEPLMSYIDDIRDSYKKGIITVVLPEFVPQKWWHHLLHNQTAIFIKGIILFKEGVVSTSVPLHLK